MFRETKVIYFQSLFIAVSVFGAIIVPGATWAAKCGYDSASYRIMPKVIGRENEIFKSPFAMPCDSMLVPKGDTTTIYEFSMLHFGANPPASSKITVMGTLIVKGKPDHPVYFSGSVKETQMGYVPAEAKWDGIEVDSGGTIRFQYARVFNAPTAMVILSKNTVMVNSFFQGTAGIVLPDTSISIGVDGTTIDMDLRKSTPTFGNSTPELVDHPRKNENQRNESGSISGKKVAIYAIAGALVTAGGITMWALGKDDSKGGSTPISGRLDSEPLYPNDPKPR